MSPHPTEITRVADVPRLADFVVRLAPFSRIAVDTEADSLHCYFEKLCLIQISTVDEDALVDPLAGFSLVPLFECLARKELIIHGADFDLRLMRRAGYTHDGTIFDTMIAARLLGVTEFSLSALIAQKFGITLAKGSQKADWARRPLSPVMEEYARNDTHFLLAIAEEFEGRLRELGRWEWFAQSCERILAQTKIDRERDVENAWRITGSNAVEGRAAAILRALWHWREEEARAVDRPPFYVLRNEEMIDAAVRFDRGEDVAVRHLRGGRQTRFFDALGKGRSTSEAAWPERLRGVRVRQSFEEQRRVVELKKIRDAAAANLQIDPSLIAPKAALDQLACDFDAAHARLLPWQRELLQLRAD